MFSDTVTITVNAVAKVLTRINQDGYSSEYLLKNSTECYSLKLRNTKYTDKTRGKVIDRHNVELVHTVYPALNSGLPSTIRKFYSVLENEEFDVGTDVVKFAAGATAFHTEANVTKLLNWES